MKKNIKREKNEISARKALIELFTYSKKLKKEFYKKYGLNLKISFNKELSSFDSKCEMEDIKNPKIKIGLYELINPGYSIAEKFVDVTVALMHEYRHAYGIAANYCNIRDNNNDNLYLLINHLATDKNPAYYEHINNYKHSPCEIDAEKFAINSAKDFMMSVFTEEESISLIIAYVNTQVETDKSYKIPPKLNGYNSLQEINDAFDKAFQNSKSHERKLELSSWDEYALLLSNYNWIDMRNKLYLIASQNHNSSNEIGYDTDKAITSLMVYLHPEYQSYIDKIEHIDLSSKKIFGISNFPLRDDELDIDNEK